MLHAMDESTVAPPDQPEQQPAATAAPPPEQAPLAATDEQRLQQADPRFYRAYTQGQQKLSAVASALGVSKEATVEQFVAAISERRQALVEADRALEADPRLAAQVASLRAREEAIARSQYPEASSLALTMMDAVKGASSLIEVSQVVEQMLMERDAHRLGGAAPATAGGSPQPQPGQPAQPAQPPAERQLMGDMGRLPGNVGMWSEEVSATREDGSAGYFRKLGEKIAALR